MKKIISQGKSKRELVEITGKKGKQQSITYHESLVDGVWVRLIEILPSARSGKEK